MRDFLRAILRTLILLAIVGSCTETIRFMGKLTEVEDYPYKERKEYVISNNSEDTHEYEPEDSEYYNNTPN